MKRVLFVSNGHGESAIAEQIARDLRAAASDAGLPVSLEHLSLVGDGERDGVLTTVGPHRSLPSGGLVAMGNVGAFARDLAAGFAGLLAGQLAYVRRSGAAADVVIAVGDSYGLAIALQSGRPTHFVGTAKSEYVASYGPFERTLLRRAASVFVRDEKTALALHARGVDARAPGNVIVDICADDAAAAPGEWIVLLPGSRSKAYEDAVTLAGVVRALGTRPEPARALLSIAPSLEPAVVARLLAEDGWTVTPNAAPFEARCASATVRAWRGNLGSLLGSASIVLGQAGTANEAAAARGLPVVALDASRGSRRSRDDWYRMRQRKLLGDALEVVPGEPLAAARRVSRLLQDPERLRAMRAAGPARLGGPGGSRAIASAILSSLRATA